MIKRISICLSLIFALLTTAALAEEPPLGPGWNLGNAFDAYLEGQAIDPLELESAWCGVRTTETTLDAVADAGFSVLRLPVSWHDHVSGDDFAIDPAWLDRVQQVADWALARGLTVILNSHHDIGAGWLYPDEAHYATSERYLAAIWRQLAQRFIDYDDRLIFEFMNEPRLKDTANEWWFDESAADCVEAAGCINQLQQLCVDTVRTAGGGNASRWLMITPYCATAYAANSQRFAWPEDPAGRLILSVHAYVPWKFALKQPGNDRFDPNNLADTREIDQVTDMLARKYVDDGIPVYIGEFGSVDRGNPADRVAYTRYYCEAARRRGIQVCVWDNGSVSGSGENFSLLNRATGEWQQPEIIAAMLEAYR